MNPNNYFSYFWTEYFWDIGFRDDCISQKKVFVIRTQIHLHLKLIY